MSNYVRDKQATVSVAHGAVVGGITGTGSGTAGTAEYLQSRRTYNGY